MITNRTALIHLSREVERVSGLLTSIYAAREDFGPQAKATAAAMAKALDSAHFAFGYGDDAQIASAI